MSTDANDVLYDRLKHFFRGRPGKEFSAAKIARILRLKYPADLQPRIDHMVKTGSLETKEGRVYNGRTVILYRRVG